MSASEFARLKELERRVLLLEQKIAQFDRPAQESQAAPAASGQKPLLGLKKAI